MKQFSTNVGLISVMSVLPISAQAVNSAKEGEQDRPNIIVILTDDMGYSDLGCYGGEIMTPNIDGLAYYGLRWSQFYNNARSCPSRACLMTGLYPHQAGMGWMAAANLQTPEYQGFLNQNCVTIAEVLGSSGYETYMAGKWHLCSDRHCQGDVVEYWPVARGFNHFYGHPEGASHYFRARLVENETRLPETGDDFYLTDALSDKASEYILEHNYDKKPLFLYLAYNAPHWPLHALPEDIEKYKDIYKAGWDQLRADRFSRQKELGLFAENLTLSPRDERVPSWESLSQEEREEFSMRMAVYAAQVDAIDRGVGKVIAALKERNEFDNTIIMIMDDNGACAEHISSGKSKIPDGSADTYESYRINWANLSSTPYREYKHYTNEGGIASPLIVSWPNGIKKEYNGEIIREYGYFADIMATCVEVSSAKYPEYYNGHQITPCEGHSLVPNFNGKTTGRGMTFWEHEVNIAVRDGKWKLNIHHKENEKIDLSKLELYDMDADPIELNNLANEEQERAQNMLEAWHKWAERVHAYPLSTDDYGKRQRAYRLMINGEFDDNFGGWVINSKDGANTHFTIDTEQTISGGKTAKVKINKSGTKPADAFLKWNFPSSEASGEVCFTVKSDCENHMWIRLEEANNPSNKVINKKVYLNGTYHDKIPFSLSKGRYQLVFYFGDSNEGNIWLDQVSLNIQ